jgi:hypothetical protein
VCTPRNLSTSGAHCDFVTAVGAAPKHGMSMTSGRKALSGISVDSSVAKVLVPITSSEVVKPNDWECIVLYHMSGVHVAGKSAKGSHKFPAGGC